MPSTKASRSRSTKSGDEFHCSGVLYSMTQAKARPYKPAGEWNTLEITMKGPRTTVKLNGVLVTDYDGVAPVPPKKGQYEPDRGSASGHGVHRHPTSRRRRLDHVQRDQSPVEPRPRMRFAMSCAAGEPCASKPAITPSWSVRDRFWLTFHLPSIRSTAISTPTIVLAIPAM